MCAKKLITPVIALFALVSATSVQAWQPLQQFPERVIPCLYLQTGVKQLNWKENSAKESRIFFQWYKQSVEGAKGDCNYIKGQPDSCEKVSFVVRLHVKRPLTGYFYPRREQAVYHYEGGLSPSDLCQKD